MREDEIWTCRDGRKIPVGEMSEEHVRNALRMILRAQRELTVRLLFMRAGQLPPPVRRTPMAEWPEDFDGYTKPSSGSPNT